MDDPDDPADESDRSTAALWVPFGSDDELPPRDESAAPGRRFAYMPGRDGFQHVLEIRDRPTDPRRRRDVDWLARFIWGAIFASAVALIALAIYIWHTIATAVHHASAPAASHGQAHNSGTVFAAVVVVVVVFITIRALSRYFRGD
jgi:hypothetical protein